MCGGSPASGFIARMMAENRVKHKGKYGPSGKRPADSEMSQPRDFDIRKIANRQQNRFGKNREATYRNAQRTGNISYGASPFILDHFAPNHKPKPVKTKCRTKMNGLFKHERGKQNVEQCE